MEGGRGERKEAEERGREPGREGGRGESEAEERGR